MAIDKLKTTSFLDESVTNLKIAVSARASTVMASSSIGDLGDVDITTSAPTNNQSLIWDNANSKFIPGNSFSQGDFDTALTASDTDDLSEGTTNLYYTDARFDTRFTSKSTTNLSEGTNLYFTNARADARIALQVGANLDLSSKSTTDLSEGTNLYYTDARFDTRFTSKSTTNLSEGTNLYFTNARADARIAAATTTDLTEGTNLYYTDARADARITAANTDDLSEGTTNLYYTDARADARITAANTDNLSEGTTNLYYTDARADARVDLVIDSAPGALNTLNELASALGDDANFSTTVTNSIATKLPLSGGTMTGNIDGNGNKVLFANVYSALVDLPSASTYHGMFAHVHSTGKGYFAHSGSWIALANDTDKLNIYGGTMTGNLLFGDNIKAIFGAGSDLQIYHDGSHSIIKDAGTGYLILGLSNAGVAIQNAAGNNLLVTDGAAVSLRHNGGQKLNTASTGVVVTGNITVTGTVDGRDVATDGTKLDGIESNAKDDQTITAGTGLTGGGTGDVTLSHADTSSQVSSNNSGRTYIQDITLDTYGHITSLATATETVTNTNLTHTGEVTGSTSLTISDNIVDEANLKVSNSPTDGYFLSAQSGNTGGLTWATVPSGYTDSDVASYLSANDYDTSTNIIAAITDSAPGTLDTLNELAAALGDDASFSTTVTNSIATKLPLAGGTMTGDVLYNDNVKAKFGAGSDLQIYHDGVNSRIYDVGTGDLRIQGTNLRLLDANGQNFLYAVQDGSVTLYHDNAISIATTSTGIDVTGNVAVSGTVDGRDISTDGTKLDGIATSANNYSHPNHTGEVTSTGDGAMVIADNVVDAGNLKVTGNGTTTQFLRSDGDGTFTWATPVDTNTVYTHPTHPGDDINIDTTALTGATVISDLDFNITTDTLGHVTDANGTVATRTLTLANLGYTGETDATADQTASEILTLVKTVDGSGSGLDADTVDGLQASSFIRNQVTYSSTYSSDNDNINGIAFLRVTGGNNQAFTSHHNLLQIPNSSAVQYDVQLAIETDADPQFKFRSGYGGASNSWSSWRQIWHDGNDGAGSGLDADLLDGNHSSAFATSAQGTKADNALPKSGGTMTGDLLAPGVNIGSTNTSYDLYNNGTSYLNGSATVDDNLLVTGNLTVQGIVTTTSAATLDVEDKIITLNFGSGDTTATADGAGIIVQDAVNSSTDASILWDTATDTFEISNNIDVTGDITGTRFTSTGSSLLRRHVSGWTIPTQDVLYSHWVAALGDYIVVRASGNTGSGHGALIVGDAGIYFGQTDSETAPTYPLDTTYGYVNSTAFYHGSDRVFDDGYHPNADTLTTARNINGVSFNGSADITVADSTKLPLAGGTITGNLNISGNGTKNLQIGDSRTDSGYAHIDLVGDTTYSDYGLRILRGNSGANTTSEILHRGTGNLEISTQEASAIRHNIAGTERLKTNSSGVTVTGNLEIQSTEPKLILSDTNNSYGGGAKLGIELDTTGGVQGFIGQPLTTSNTIYITNKNSSTNSTTSITNTGGGNIVLEPDSGSAYVSSNKIFHDGYHPNADTLTTARNINGVSFDGSADITVADSTKLPLSGGTLTGDVTFGDNNKAIFGAGSDLQIYHDGSNSYIRDAGVGNLYVRANVFRVYNAAQTEISANFVQNGAVTLYHDAVAKIATASTGIDVTGNVTVSGTVDGRNVANDGTKLDGIESGATADQTKADIDALNIDADTLDSLNSTQFIRSDAADTATGKITFDGGIEGQAIFLSGAQNFDNLKDIGFYSLYNVNASGHTNAPFQYGAMISSNSNASGGMGMQLAHERTGNGTYIRGMNDTGDTWYDWDEIWTSGTDGSGSGLDADLLDGQHGSYYQKKTTVQDAAPSGATGDLWYESDSGSFYVYYGGAWVDVAPGVETNTNLQINSLGVGTAASGTAGEIRATNDVTAYYSDERLKDFHGNIDSALDKVNQLNGYYFTENETAKELGYDNDKRQVGVSAQEVEAVLPEVVAEAPISDEYLTVKYEKLAPLFIEAIKEIDKKYQDKIDILMEEIEKLKGN